MVSKTKPKMRARPIEEQDDNAEHLEYFRVARGQPYPVPADLFEQTEEVEGREFIIEKAMRSIWDYNKHRRIYALGRGYQCAMDVVAHGLGLDPERATLAPRRLRKVFFAMVSLALAKARQDTRYWGVNDPAVQSYCSVCREVVELGKFKRCEWVCDDCMGQHDTAADTEEVGRVA